MTQLHDKPTDLTVWYRSQISCPFRDKYILMRPGSTPGSTAFTLKPDSDLNWFELLHVNKMLETLSIQSLNADQYFWEMWLLTEMFLCQIYLLYNLFKGGGGDVFEALRLKFLSVSICAFLFFRPELLRHTRCRLFLSHAVLLSGPQTGAAGGSYSSHRPVRTSCSPANN